MSTSLKKKIAPLYRQLKRTFFCAISLLRIFSPPNKKYWAFPVHFVKHSFCDNVQAVFEEVKHDSSIHKIIFTRGQTVTLENTTNVTIVNMFSFKAVWLLAQCRVIFVQHSLALDFLLRWSLFRYFIFKRCLVVNLWHGVAIKYIRSAVEYVKHDDEHKHYAMVIASSKVDRLVMSASFYPALFKDIVVTGLPRNDYLMCDEQKLPNILQQQLHTIENITQHKKLILYAPTYRELGQGGKYYIFNEAELQNLKQLLKQHNAVLGLRPHHQKYSKSQFDALVDNEFLFDMGTDRLPDMSMLIRKADLIITDYSSLFVDALYLNKSQISFAYDLEHYENIQRGLFYDFKMVFPGPVCTHFNALVVQLNLFFKEGKLSTEKNEQLKKLFFDDIDSKNSFRVVKHVKQLSGS